MSKRVLALLVTGSVPLALFVGSLSPIGEVGLVVTVGVLMFASREVSRFRWDLLRGAAAGAVAGIAVLGPGLRLAMRLVAVADPDRVLEFTIGGTMFIVIALGLIFGAIVGGYVISAGRLLELRRAIVSFAAAVGLMLFLLGNADLRSELTDLGLGVWVNIPMFGAVGFAHGWTTDVLARRFEHRVSSRRRTEPVGVS